MLDLFDLGLIFIVIMLAAAVLMVLGNYWYKNLYLPSLETAEPPFADSFREIIDNMTHTFTESFKDVKVDIDMEKISETLTQNMAATFLTILGIEDYSEEWSFQDYLKTVIDSSIEDIVPETVKQFEEILPQFADQFVSGIQEALTGAVTGMPDAPAGGGIVPQGSGGVPDMDIGKMIQMMLLQYMVKSMGGGGGLGSLLGSLGGGAPSVGGPSSSGF